MRFLLTSLFPLKFYCVSLKYLLYKDLEDISDAFGVRRLRFWLPGHHYFCWYNSVHYKFFSKKIRKEYQGSSECHFKVVKRMRFKQIFKLRIRLKLWLRLIHRFWPRVGLRSRIRLKLELKIRLRLSLRFVLNWSIWLDWNWGLSSGSNIG